MAENVALLQLTPTAVLFMYLSAGIMQLTSLILFSYLLYGSFQPKGTKFTPVMTLYVVTCVLQSFFALSHFGYMAIFWKADTAVYNSYILYFTGTIALILYSNIGITITLLSIERLLIVIYPTKYHHQSRFYGLYFSIVVLVLFSILMVVYDFAPDFPAAPTTSCRSHACLRVQSQALLYLHFKYIIAISNVIMGVILGLTLRKHFRGTHLNAKANRLIFAMMVIAFIADFLPNCFTFIREIAFDYKITIALGPFAIYVASIDIVACSLLYSKTFFYTKSNSNVVSVSRSGHL